MGKRWVPSDNPVGENELVGRRLFDEPLLAGAADNQPIFNGLMLSHFEEKRSNELSLDRLGRTNVEPKVQDYLVPRAKLAGKFFHRPKNFNGWAVVRVKELSKAKDPPSLEVIASPIYTNQEQDELIENIYHAHTVLPDDKDPHHIALHLRHIFSKQIINIDSSGSEKKNKILNLLSNIFKHFWD